jgi:hypothetical protein
VYPTRTFLFISISSIFHLAVRRGFQSLLQLCGVGRLRPNTAVLGWKADWRSCVPGDAADYVGMISDALDVGLGVALLRPTLRTGSCALVYTCMRL